MIASRATRARYTLTETYLPFVLQRVRETLLGFADAQGYAVLGRAKSLESVSEKIETGRFSTWSEIDDLVACAIIIPKIADEPEVLSFLRKAFSEKETFHRGRSLKASDVFRFESTRFIAKLLRPEDVALTEPAYDIVFEIQVRTAFEHAWAVTTHGLTYKNDEISWERQRLAAQLKATVEQLDMLVTGFEDNIKFIPISSWPETDAKKIIAKSFQRMFDSKRLPEELKPKDWTRFSENLFSLLKASSSRHNDPHTEKATKAAKSIEDFLDANNAVPLSLSLLQFVFAVLVTQGVIQPPFRKYMAVITEEMELLYPAVSNVTARFDFYG